MKTQTFDEWLEENWEWKDKEKTFFPPGMSAEKAMEFLCIYFIDNGSIAYPASREQIFTEVVGKLLHKYSDKYKKEQKSMCRVSLYI